MEHKNINLEIKRFDPDSRTISGYASTFGFPADVQGDVIMAGAFANSIHKIKKEGIPLLDSHKQDSEHVLGTVIDAYEDAHGLYITARLADTPRVEEIRQKLKQGHINKMSIGFFIGKQHFTNKGGQEYRMIDEAHLIEISVVPIPANSRATILSVKAQDTQGAAVSEEVEEASMTTVPPTAEAQEEALKCEIEEKTQETINEDSEVLENLAKPLQEDGVRADEATENASDCETPADISLEEKQALESIAALLQQSLNSTRRKYNGK